MNAIAGRLAGMTVPPPSFDGVTWMKYVRKHAGGATYTQIGNKVGVSGSSVSRWDKSRPDPTQAAAFARAYGRPVLEAFIAAGFLTPEEAGQRPTAAPSLASLSDDDLLTEVGRRMQGGQQDAGQAEAQKNHSGLSAVPKLPDWAEPTAASSQREGDPPYAKDQSGDEEA